jgi:hypothetical protein
MPINYPIITSGGGSGNAIKLQNRDINSNVPKPFQTLLWNSGSEAWTPDYDAGTTGYFKIYLSSSAETGSFRLKFVDISPNIELNWQDLGYYDLNQYTMNEEYPYWVGEVSLPKKFGPTISASFNAGSSYVGGNYDTSLGNQVSITQDLNNTNDGTIQQGGGGGGGGALLVTVYAPGSSSCSSTSELSLTKFKKFGDNGQVIVIYEINSTYTGSLKISGSSGETVYQLTGTTGELMDYSENISFNDNSYTLFASSSNASSNFLIYNIIAAF